MKEIIKQFSGTIYKFVFCDLYEDGSETKVCDKIHIYERRVVELEPYKARFFYIGDLETDPAKYVQEAIYAGTKTEHGEIDLTGLN